MPNKNNSPYSAAVTGCGFMFDEMNSILPLLMHPDGKEKIKEEIVKNEYLKMNTEKTRKRAMAEFVRRYNAVPASFWEAYLQMSEEAKLIAMFFVLLKTYRILFDFHINVTVNNWQHVSQSVDLDDIKVCINDIAANDEFVDSWSDETKRRVGSFYLTFLRRIGMLGPNSTKLVPLSLPAEDFAFYIKCGEDWFLDACLLQPYEINNIRTYAL